MSSVIQRMVAEARYFGNTLLEAALHPMSTCVVDKTSGEVVSRISSKASSTSGKLSNRPDQSQTIDGNIVGESPEQPVTEGEAELSETRKATRAMLELLEADLDSSDASKRYSLQELSRIRKFFDEMNAKKGLASDNAPGQ